MSNDHNHVCTIACAKSRGWARTMWEKLEYQNRRQKRALIWKACAKRWRSEANTSLDAIGMYQGRIDRLEESADRHAEERASLIRLTMADSKRIRELEAELESFRTAERARLAAGGEK